MTEDELNAIHEAAKLRVQVWCDEYHAHTTNCLTGPEDAINICKLYQEVMRLRRLIKSAADGLND